MALKNAIQKKSRKGYFVAVRRDTGMPWLISADHYDQYGEEFEKGQFFHDFSDAALAEKSYREELFGDGFRESTDDVAEVEVINPIEVVGSSSSVLKKSKKENLKEIE